MTNMTTVANTILVPDSSVVKVNDTLKSELPDTLKNQKSKSTFNDPVFSDAVDSMFYSKSGKELFLYNQAVVKYQEIELKAGFIAVNLERNEVFATGIPDSTGAIVQKPVFNDKGTEYQMDELIYNFNSKKAIIKGMASEYGEGRLLGDRMKKMPDDKMNIAGGKYTTCAHDDPHYYIRLTKAKVIPDEKIATGPAYLVIEGIPVYPAFIPFGIIPLSKDRTSGVLFPTYGEEERRGFFLKDGGYYFALSPYYDFAVSGSVYSKGSWDMRASSRYKVMYKFGGNFSFDYGLYRIDDDKTVNDTKTWRVQWTHQQDAKFRPGTNFSANVNFSSTSYNNYTNSGVGAGNNAEYLKNTAQSSISYSKNWAGTPFSMAMNLNHSQNFADSTMNLGLPRLSFNVRQIYPLQNPNRVGQARWWEKIALSYNLNMENRINGKEDVIFTNKGMKDWKNGFQHKIPLSTSFNILKYISISPSVNYTGTFYLSKVDKRNVLNSAGKDSLVTDTIRGFYPLHQYSFSTSASTRVYGMYDFGKNSTVKAIRHMATFSIGFSYTPGFDQYYKSAPGDATGRQFYSMYEQGIYGTPGRNESGNVSFNWGNNLEMKVKSKKDTVTGFTKIKLLESFNLSTSYNLLADSLNLSKISLTGRTNILNTFNLSFNASFDPYSYNKLTGATIAKYEVNQSGNLARLTNAGMNLDFSLKSTLFDSKEDKNKSANRGRNYSNPFMNNIGQNRGLGIDNQEEQQIINNNYYEYVDFNAPWDLSIRYNISVAKVFDKSIMDMDSRVTQTLNFSGNISLTSNWKISMTSGWDFKLNKLTYTSLNIMRDLDCWEMRMSWVPFGRYKSYSFQINVKSSLLQDLKITKRENWLDNY